MPERSAEIPRYILDQNADGSEVVRRVTDKDENPTKAAEEAERELCNRCRERIGVGRPFHRVTNSMKDKRLYHVTCTRAL